MVSSGSNVFQNFAHEKLNRDGLSASRSANHHEMRRSELRRNSESPPSDSRISLLENELAGFACREIDWLSTSSNELVDDIWNWLIKAKPPGDCRKDKGGGSCAAVVGFQIDRNCENRDGCGNRDQALEDSFREILNEPRK